MGRTSSALALTLITGLALFGCADAPDEEAELDTEMGEETGEVGPEEDMAGEYGFADWDADASESLDREEWTTWSGEQDWTGWNTDTEDGLTGEEFGAATVNLWDTDDDDRISETEWREGTNRWFGEDAEYGTWTDWDGDGDSFLDANEVREGFESNNLYDRVDGDADAVIDDEELADWFFDVFDLDDDDEIDTTEWDWGEQAGYTGERGAGYTG